VHKNMVNIGLAVLRSSGDMLARTEGKTRSSRNHDTVSVQVGAER